jgi:hypothetical protein
MKTERAKELLKHFKQNGVSHDAKASGGLKFVLEWQDIIGQATNIEVAQFEGSLPELAPDGVDRDTFLFVNMHALRYETAIYIFRQTHGARIKAVLEAEVRQELKACADGVDIGLAANKAKEAELGQMLIRFTNLADNWEREKETLQSQFERAAMHAEERGKIISEQLAHIERLKTMFNNVDADASKWHRLKELVKELMK